MSLAHATLPDGTPAHLAGAPPFSCDALGVLEGVPFQLPCDDPWILDGEGPGHAYLDAAETAWDSEPQWMDFLDLDSPGYDLKRASRDIYLHHWADWLDAKRVMDVGCGIGRMTQPFLDRGATVIGVDGDLGSLQRCAWYAARRPGHLDLHWSSTSRLPDIANLDVIVACEVLCYVDNLEQVLADLTARLRPGGALLLSMEAEWGWATGPDAPPDGLAVALSGETVDLPGDRWVRTLGRDALADLLTGAGLVPQDIVATHYLIDGPLEGVMPRALSEEDLLAAEAACRTHPVWAPLNRIWTAVAVKPSP